MRKLESQNVVGQSSEQSEGIPYSVQQCTADFKENYKQKLVILGCGYLGYNLARLLNDSFDVTVYGHEGDYSRLLSNFVRVDVFSQDGVGSLDVDDAVVIDAVTVVNPTDVSERETEFLAELGQRYSRLISRLFEDGAKQVVFLSSAGVVYGNTYAHASEDSPIKPITLHGKVKAYLEDVVRECAPNWLILRPSNIYGPAFQKNLKQGIIPALIRCAYEESELLLWGDVDDTRDYLYIDDFAHAIKVLLERGVSREVFNVASGDAYSLGDVVAAVEQATGKKIHLKSLVANAPRIESVSLDTSKLRDDCGFEPQVCFEEGIARSVAWFVGQSNHGVHTESSI